jgi:hypothetical protein
MTTGKNKGIVGLASDRLRETNGALRGEGPWHSEVYHKNRKCQKGNSIAPENIEQAVSRSARSANDPTAWVVQ